MKNSKIQQDATKRDFDWIRYDYAIACGNNGMGYARRSVALRSADPEKSKALEGNARACAETAREYPWPSHLGDKIVAILDA